MLALKQPMQQRGAGAATIGGKPALDNLRCAVDRRQHFLERGRLAISGFAVVAVFIGKRQQGGSGRRAAGIGRGHDRSEDFGIALRIDRKLVLEVPRGEAARRGVVAKLDFTGLQCIAVRASKDRQQHAGQPAIRDRFPIDVEGRSMRRVLAPFQHVEPPVIVGLADAHVVRHEVENEAEVVRSQRIAHARESLVAAQFGIEAVVIDDVVTVGAAGACFQKRRSIEMADAERLEIGSERGGVIEGEILGELDPIGRERDGRRHGF